MYFKKALTNLIDASKKDVTLRSALRKYINKLFQQVEEGAEAVAQAEALKGIVVDRVERDLGRAGEAVVELGVDARLLAVVVIVLGRVIPEVRGLVGGRLEVPRGAEIADGLLAVEQVDRDAEVALLAEHAEDLLPGGVEERMGAVALAHGIQIGKDQAGGNDTAYAQHGAGVVLRCIRWTQSLSPDPDSDAGRRCRVGPSGQLFPAPRPCVPRRDAPGET